MKGVKEDDTGAEWVIAKGPRGIDAVGVCGKAAQSGSWANHG